MAITHSTPADASFSEEGKRAWNADHTGTIDASDATFTQSGSGATSRTVQARLRETISVKDFGALGDDSTDDTTAIQNAINSVSTTTDGGYCIYFPPGIYQISSALAVGQRRIIFKGSGVIGSRGTTIKQTASNTHILDYSSSHTDVISVEDIQLQGPSTDGTGCGIVIGSAGTQVFDSRINNVWFVGIQDKAISGVNMQGFHITNCAFDSSGATDEFGVYITKGSDNIIANNRFYGQVGGGVVILDGDNNTINSNHFDLCGAANDTSGAIYLDADAGNSKVIRGTLICGNNFRGNKNDIVLDGNSGVYLNNTGVLDTLIVGNVTDRAGRQFLHATDAHQTRVIGNAIATTNQDSASLNAVEITGTCDRTVIEGNSVSLGNSAPALPVYGLALGASTTNTVLGPNAFQGSTGDVSINASATLAEASSYVQAGSWTPAVGGNATYTTQEGYYRKQGKLVFVYGKLVINTIGTGSTTTISGLPFTSKNATNASTASGSVAYFSSLASNVTFLNPVVNNNSTQMYFSSIGAAGATATAVTTVFGDGTRIDFTATYLAAQ